ncbi:MAG TPA: hypothetical protein DCY20_08200, partial [Firmicutes bacterium]|nr:hypothetical protein [Bacillota bacterium]
MNKFLIGLGAVLIGGATVTALTYGGNSKLEANASGIEESVRAKLDDKYGENWDDVLEGTYGDDWAEEIESKYNHSISSVVLDEVRRLIVLDELDDAIEDKLESLYGDDWDDLLEEVYGDDWDDVLELKYGKEYILQLETILKEIWDNYPQLQQQLQLKNLDDLD